jgi:hypothetical protein
MIAITNLEVIVLVASFAIGYFGMTWWQRRG